MIGRICGGATTGSSGIGAPSTAPLASASSARRCSSAARRASRSPSTALMAAFSAASFFAQERGSYSPTAARQKSAIAKSK